MFYFISVFLIFLIVPLMLSFIIHKVQSTKISSPYLFRYPKILTIIFLLTIVTIIILFILAWLLDADGVLALYIFLYAFYSLFTIALAYAFLKCLNIEVILEDNYILYRNLFGIVKKKKYEEISKIITYRDRSQTPVKYRIYFGNHSIEVDHLMINFNNFPKIAKKRLRNIKSTIQF